MELRHLRYFVAVAEELHFGRAAARLHMAQPPLSQQIRQLEDELGVRLLARTNRRVALTEAGRVLLDGARRVLALADETAEAARRADRGEVGRLALGFVGSATYEALPALLRAYGARYPGVEVALHQMTTAEQVAALAEGRIAAGLVRPPVPDAGLALLTLRREAFVAALPRDHRLAGDEGVSIRALADESFIMFPRTQGAGLYDLALALCTRGGFAPRIAQVATEMQTIVGLVAAGMGVALVPASLRRLRPDDVAYVAIREAAPDVELALAWRTGDEAPVVRALAAVARELKGADVDGMGTGAEQQGHAAIAGGPMGSGTRRARRPRTAP